MATTLKSNAYIPLDDDSDPEFRSGAYIPEPIKKKGRKAVDEKKKRKKATASDGSSDEQVIRPRRKSKNAAICPMRDAHELNSRTRKWTKSPIGVLWYARCTFCHAVLPNISTGNLELQSESEDENAAEEDQTISDIFEGRQYCELEEEEEEPIALKTLSGLLSKPVASSSKLPPSTVRPTPPAEAEDDSATGACLSQPPSA